MKPADFGKKIINLAEHRREDDVYALLKFCVDIPKDNPWYEIEVYVWTDDGKTKTLETHRFNSIKKALKWWDKFF